MKKLGSRQIAMVYLTQHERKNILEGKLLYACLYENFIFTTCS
ncbi:hypothetical protein RINTHH_22260 [Richelia intracellularis HH01]|uniref:Uncharacterized protein n=1 Tax=Richelia intracellularis HH01 TaxID=1165094 RepID=M1X6R1_9NOST|nr:hypothetical protein RINTHH_22260 [Richelia intracellularis HH01]